MADNQDIKTVLEDILRALQGAGTGARGTSSAIRDLTTATQGLGSATRDVAGDLDDLTSGQDRNTESEKRAEEQRRRAWKELQNETNEITSLSGALGVANKALELYKKQNQAFAKAVRNVTIAFKGMAAGAKVTAAAMKGIFSIGGSLISMFADIGAAIISIPFKFFNHVFSKAKQLMSGGTEIAQSYENVRKVFGDTGSGLGKSVIDLGKNLTKGVIAPGLSARRVFGDLSEAINYANEVASASPEAFQAVSDQFSGRNGLEILSMAKGLGLANEELVGFMDSAIATGQPMETMLTEVTKYAEGMGDAFGLNSKMISRSMGKAAKDIKHFANSSIKEIAQATVYAQKLGVSLESITGILDSFNTFESAADNVSKLSQAFGVNIDAMKLLEAKTPDEALDQIKQAFAAAGKSADQMNRQELQLIASTVGMDEATVRKTLSMNNAGVSMSNVKGVANSLEKQTMDTSQALSKLSKDIEKMVKAGQPPEGENFFDVFVEGILMGIDRTEEMRKLFKEVAFDMVKVREQGRLLGEAIMEYFPGFKKFINGLTVRLKDVPGLFADIRESFTKFMQGLKGGTMTFSALMDMLRGNFTEFMGGDNSEMMSGLTEMWGAVKKILAEGINWVTDSLRDALKAVLKFLRGDPMGDAGGLFGDVAKEVQPISDALGRMWTELKGPLWELMKEAGKVFVDALWEGFKALPFEAYLAMAAPSLMGGALNTAGSKGLGWAAGKIFGKGAATSAAPALPTTSTIASNGRVLPPVRPPPLPPGAPPPLPGAAPLVGTAGLGAAAATVGATAAAAGAVYMAYDQYSELEKELEYGTTRGRGVGMMLAEAELEDVQAMQNSALVSLDQKMELTQQYMHKQGEIMKNASSDSELFKDAEARFNASAEAMRGFRKKREEEALAFVEGTPQFQARLEKEAKEANKKKDAAMLQSMGLKDNMTLENAEKTLKNINEIAQKILNVDIESVLKKVREKFANQDWSVMKEDSQKKLKESLISLGHVVTLFEGFGKITQAAKTAVSQIADMGRPDDPSTPLGMLSKNSEGYIDTAIAVGGYVDTLGDWTAAKRKLENASTTAGDVGNMMRGIVVASQGQQEIKPIDDETQKNVQSTIQFFMRVAGIVGSATTYVGRDNTMKTGIGKIPEVTPLIAASGAAFDAITAAAPHLDAAGKATEFLPTNVPTEFPKHGISRFMDFTAAIVQKAVGEWSVGSGILQADTAKSSFESVKGMVEAIGKAITTFSQNESKFRLYENVNVGQFSTSALNFQTIMNSWLGSAAAIASSDAAKAKVGELEKTVDAMSSFVKKVTPLEGELNSLASIDWSVPLESLSLTADVLSNDESNQGAFISKIAHVDPGGKLHKKIDDTMAVATDLSRMAFGLKTLKDNLTNIPNIKGDEVVAQMNKAIRAVNTINRGLETINLGERSVDVKLGKAVSGVTNKAFEPIKTGQATINLTVQVSMSAADIERGLVNSPSTTIKAAINELAAGQKMQVAGPGLKLGPIATTPGGEAAPKGG